MKLNKIELTLSIMAITVSILAFSGSYGWWKMNRLQTEVGWLKDAVGVPLKVHWKPSDYVILKDEGNVKTRLARDFWIASGNSKRIDKLEAEIMGKLNYDSLLMDYFDLEVVLGRQETTVWQTKIRKKGYKIQIKPPNSR